MKIQSPSIITNLTVSGSFDLTESSKTSLVNQITGSLNTIYIQTGSVDEFMIMAVSDETNPLTAGKKLTFRTPYALSLYQTPRASLTSGSTSGNVIVDINSGSTSILGGTKITIDQNQRTSTTSTSPSSLALTYLPDDTEISVDIDSPGTSATGLKITLYYRKG